MIQWNAPLSPRTISNIFRRDSLNSYIVAIGLVGLAYLIRILMEPAIGDRVPFASFFFAVALTAWFGGYGPCLAAVALNTLVCWYFVLPLRNSFQLPEAYSAFGLAAFVFTGIVIATFSGKVRHTVRQLAVAEEESARRANEAEEAQRRLTTLLDHVPDGITLTGAPPDFPIIAMSNFARQAFGDKAEQLVGASAGPHALNVGVYRADVIGVPAREEVPLYRATRLGQRVENEEWVLRRPDGSVLHMLCNAVPVYDREKRIIAGIGCWRDITEQRQLQEERNRLLESERSARRDAEQSNRVKDEFLSTLSHELRSPLSAIVGWAQLLKMRTPDEATLKQALEAIERNGKAQARLIDDLLDMSRIVSGQFRLEVQSVDLAPLIRSTAESMMPGAQAKNISIRQALDPEVGRIKGDPHRLQQVILNLLSNAVKFTPRGGKIEVLLEQVNLHCTITVIDSGRGIKPEFLPRVFDRFRQEDGSRSRLEGGLGLGLAIVKQLVEYHGGTVTAESPGEHQGSTFIVRFPIEIRQEAASSELSPIASAPLTLDLSLAGMRVLVVDDDADTCTVLVRLLQQQQAHIKSAVSVDEGMKLLRREPFDILVSDIGMPGQDGYAFIAQVRQMHEPVRSIAAVAVTAFARPEDRIAALQAGYNMHVAKPLDARELLTVLARLKPTDSR